MALWAVVAAAPAVGQQAAAGNDLSQLSIEQLSNVEITTVSRRPEPLAQAPAAIYVITTEDIRRSGAVNLPEVLRLAPNLEVARLNGLAYTITARGFNSPESANKLLVMVDGRSVYSPLAGSVFWENVSVSLPDIERIEVVSGPGGTLYGANAVNGIINIITKSAADTQGLQLNATAGTTDDAAVLSYGSTPWEGGSLRLYGQVQHANSTAPLNAADTTLTAWLQTKGGFRFDQALDGDTLMLEGDLFDNRTPLQDLEFYRGYDLNGRWTHGFESGSSLSLQLSSDENSRILPGLAREQLDTYDLQIQHDTSLGWNDSFIWGGEYRRSKESFYSESIFAFAQPTTVIDVANLFAQEEVSLLDDVKLTAGVKVENSSYSNVEFLPNVRLAWQVSPSDMLWASVSRAVRTPSKIDRELESPDILLPAPNFRNEKLNAYELGYRGTPLEDLSLSASLYFNFYADIRTDHYNPTTITPIQLRNGIQGDNYGGELWAKYALTGWWRLSAGASWLQRTLHLKPGRNDYSPGQSIGQDPPYQLQLRSEMNPFADWQFDAALRAVGPVTQRDSTTGASIPLVGSYVEADLRVGYQVNDSTELSLAGLNLLHDRHLEAYDPSTYPPQYVPRSVMLSLRKRF